MKPIKTFYNQIFCTKNRYLLLYEVLLISVVSILFIPLMKYLFRCVMNGWEQSYLTEKNIISFISFPPMLLFVFFAFILFNVIITFNTVTLLHLCMNHETNSLLSRIKFAFIEFFQLVTKYKINLFISALIMSLFTNLFFIIGVLFHFKISSYLFKGESDPLFIKGLLLSITLCIIIFAYRRIYKLPWIILGKSSDLMAWNNKKINKDQYSTYLILFLFVNLMLILMVSFLYFITLKVTILFVYLNTDYFFTMTEFIYRYPQVNKAFRLIMSILSFVVNINMFCSFTQKIYINHNDFITPPGSPLNKLVVLMQPKTMKYKFISLYAVTTLCILILFLISNYSTFYQVSVLSKTKVTSHRGYSQVAPENTIPAIKKALEARVDHIEIDIQQTKDGKLILLHDKSLRRTTGLDKKIWNINYKKLSKLDAGSWFSSDYKNTHIPTLEEVFKLCKGKVILNLEIKTHGKEDNLEEKLIDLIHKYDLETQCFVSSLTYDTLKRVKELNSQLKTNLIITTEPDGNYQLPYVDSLSYRSHYITRKVVEDIHTVGKEVHAWTVNDIEEINRLKNIGVDSITTDDPVLTQHVLYADVLNNYFYPNFRRLQSIPVIKKLKSWD